MKIAVVGGGNAGCLTALHYSFHTRFADFIEIELIHNPDILPEPVGQATTLDPPQLLWGALNFDWYHNPIHATFKSGILYEGWVRRMIRYSIAFLLIGWQCIFVLGSYKSLF